MAIEFISWALKLKVPSGPKFVLVALANRANELGECWPSQRDISDQTSMSTRTIRDHLVWLVNHGYISKTQRRRENGSYTSDCFEIQRQQSLAAKSAVGEKVSQPAAKSAYPEPSLTTSYEVVETSAPETEAAKAIWNDYLGDILPKVQVLSDDRKKKLKARLKQLNGIDGWKVYLAKIRGSPFLTGKNEKGWKADFDFAITESKMNKILEGSYVENAGTRGNINQGGRQLSKHDRAKQALRRSAESLGYGGSTGGPEATDEPSVSVF